MCYRHITLSILLKIVSKNQFQCDGHFLQPVGFNRMYFHFLILDYLCVSVCMIGMFASKKVKNDSLRGRDI